MRAPKDKIIGKVEPLIVLNQTVDIVDVAHGVQTRATTISDFFAPGMCYTSYLNIQHLGAEHFFFVLTRVFARFQQLCTLEASLQIFWNNIGSFSQTNYWAQLTEDIRKYKHPYFLFFRCFKKIHVTHNKHVFCHFVVYIFFKILLINLL